MNDLNMIRYFWENKGDIERYNGYDEASLERSAPHVLKAWKDYKIARSILDAVISTLPDEPTNE